MNDLTNQLKRLEKILLELEYGNDGIYNSQFSNAAQESEILMREKVVENSHDDYLKMISHHHSIPVMDREVIQLLQDLPEYSIVLDIGGSWGWHWRKLAKQRPDIKVIILDFIRNNLTCASELLGNLINNQIFLVHGDATQSPFSENSFELVWTVQTFQHIPDFELAVKESYRVLITDGRFINYSLNRACLIEMIYMVLRKNYHIKGHTKTFYLARASKEQSQILVKIFNVKVSRRFTEILFHPDLKLSFSGKENSFFGGIDAWLGGNTLLLGWLARQQSFEVQKI